MAHTKLTVSGLGAAAMSKLVFPTAPSMNMRPVPDSEDVEYVVEFSAMILSDTMLSVSYGEEYTLMELVQAKRALMKFKEELQDA